MKRGDCRSGFPVGALCGIAYFTASKWAIRHETITFYDLPSRDKPSRAPSTSRSVATRKCEANAGMIDAPVAVIDHGNTVKNTEYGFLANVFAARAATSSSARSTIFRTDPPMVTKPGELYVGRLPQILRGVANIHLAMQEMKKWFSPAPTCEKVTMVRPLRIGRRHHVVYFAKKRERGSIRGEVQEGRHARPILRVPLRHRRWQVQGHRQFRSQDAAVQDRRGRDPDRREECERPASRSAKTEFQSTPIHARHRSGIGAKNSIQGMLDKRLSDTDSAVAPVDTRSAPPKILEPGPAAADGTRQELGDRDAAISSQPSRSLRRPPPAEALLIERNGCADRVSRSRKVKAGMSRAISSQTARPRCRPGTARERAAARPGLRHA
ncbi:hypothetical protein ACRAWF_06475 [Streptomyces sp. L7]